MNKTSSKSISIDVPINELILTPTALSEILNALIEFLSYHRNQIPFPFPQFKSMLRRNKILTDEEADHRSTYKDFQLDKQKSLATQTVNSMDQIFNIVSEVFENSCGARRAMILFGSTILTPREAFVINLPPSNRNHNDVNHRNVKLKIKRKIILSLITSKLFIDSHVKHLIPTNMFIFLEADNQRIPSIINFCPAFDFSLPINCKTTTINVKNEPPSDDLGKSSNCCDELSVFTDHSNLNSSTELNLDSTRERDNGLVDDEHPIRWFECNESVKGFKDVLVKGTSIWERL